ncbi:type IV pilus assembly protein PilX [Natronospira proteinivora]|uniref:Type IV pilus assembly protein PilX n=1 Tax=Natronospira proteinivora TaxID=1807133 RepID=A0ABT1G7D5_9GAMM|nr:PilX N-terminal domain-containing pilus assembly protein [Natronospira proteinivora]MCP1726273.1 type IV pilus assembly protein PilX [Natronospira proteinivora]
MRSTQLAHTRVVAPSRQGGAVLLFSLIVLLLLTVIGVTAMQTTTLQERMAGGQRDRHLAVQGAEAAVREAERFLQQATLPQFLGAENGLYHHNDYPAPSWQDFGWGSGYRNYDGGDMDGLLAEAPGYYIERLPPVANPDGSLVGGEAIEDTEFYRITARSTGGSGQSEVIVQVIFRR